LTLKEASSMTLAEHGSENPYLRDRPPLNWRLPVPPRIARLPEGERVAEACRMAAGGMHPLQACATCGLAWAVDLLDEAVALGHAGCAARLHELRDCATQAFRHYDGLAWNATGDAEARVPRLPGDWTQRAGREIAPYWGWLGLVYVYAEDPVLMATTRPAFIETTDDELTVGTGIDLLPADLLEQGEDGEVDRPARVLMYTPVSLRTLRRRVSPDADLLPGLTRARGFVHTGGYDCAGPQFRFEPTGVRPPLVERGHESTVVRAARKDALTTTMHAPAYKGVRWHRERVEAIRALVEADPEADRPEDDDRPGYAFWDGHRMNLAGPLTDSLYEQHTPHTLRATLPPGRVYAPPRARPEDYVPAQISASRLRATHTDTAPKPTPLALWWAFVCPGTDPLRDHGDGVRAFLEENARYWDGERPHLHELRALIQRQARAEGVPMWPSPDEIDRASKRADHGFWNFDGTAYATWAVNVIAAYAREQLAGVPYPDEAFEWLWYRGTSGYELYEIERARANAARSDAAVERPLLQSLFTPNPGAGRAYLITGREPWAQRPVRSRKPAINGPAEQYGEAAALNQLDQFAAAVRAGALGDAPRPLLAFASTLQNFLESALGNATMAGRGTVEWLHQDGQATTLLELVRAEDWRAWQETRHPERGVFGPDPYVKPLYAYLADPKTLYTELAPAVLWVHQVCFAQLTGRGFRLYVSKANLGYARNRGFVSEAQVEAVLAAGALGRVTDQAFRQYPADDAPRDWVRRPWTPARLRQLARGAFGIAQRARDGLPVPPGHFRAMAEAMGYPESAIALGLARLGAGLTVASVAGFGHLDEAYRFEEQGLPPGERRGLLGRAWQAGTPFARIVDRLSGYVEPDPATQPAQPAPSPDAGEGDAVQEELL